MAARSYEITHSFGSASIPLAVILIALTAGSEPSRARGGYIWTLAAAGIVAGVESESSTPSEGVACQPPEWLLGVWVFSDFSVTQGGMTNTHSDPNMAMSPTKLTFTPGSPTYEYAGGCYLQGRGEITSVSGEVVKAAIWPINFKVWSRSPVTIARTTKGIAVTFSVTSAGTGFQISATYTRVPDCLGLPGWLPGRWALIRGMDMGSLSGSTIKLPMTLVFRQGSPTYDFTRGPSLMGKDVIVSIKNGMVTLCFSPNILGTARATLSQVPEGVALEVVLREDPKKLSYKAIYTRVQDHPVLPAWLPGWWVLGRSTMTRAGVTTTLGSGPGPVLIPLALTFTQGSPLYDFTGGAVLPGQAVVSNNDVVEVTPWSTWPTKALLDSARITQVPEGIALDFATTIGGDHSPSQFRALYTRVQDHPELPAWLPGRWVLSRSTTTRAGSPSAPHLGQTWFPTTLAFTQGSPTYDYAGGPVPPGKGTIFPKGKGAGITPWPVIELLPFPTAQSPPTGESFSPAQATVARAAEGVVIELSGTTKAGEPVRYQGVYTPFREHPELPAWLTGKWRLTKLDMSGGGMTQTYPLDQVDAPVPTNLTFTQGSPTYVYASGLVPAGQDEVLSFREGVVTLSIGSAETPLPLTSATATPTPEGIEVTFSSLGAFMNYKGHYTGGQEHRALLVHTGGQEHSTLPDWLPGKWALTHHTMTYAGQTTDFPEGTGVIQVATTLAFTQGSPTYDYAGGPVPPGKGTIAIRDGAVRITLWPTNVPSLPATIARTPEGIVVEFTHTIYGGGASNFRVFYGPAW